MFKKLIFTLMFGVSLAFFGAAEAQFKVHTKNLAKVGTKQLQKSLEKSSMKAATLTTARFCSPRIKNFSKLLRTINRSGYLEVFSDQSEGLKLFAHPSGAPTIITVQSRAKGNGCGGVAGNRRVSEGKLKRMFEESTGDTLIKLAGSRAIRNVGVVWQSRNDPKIMYSLYVHPRIRSPLVLHLTK